MAKYVKAPTPELAKDVYLIIKGKQSDKELDVKTNLPMDMAILACEYAIVEFRKLLDKQNGI